MSHWKREKRTLILKASPKKSPPKKKRFHPWKSKYLITYKWLLRQEDGKLFCKYCTTRLTGHEFFKGWSGNKEVCNTRREFFFKECRIAYLKLCPVPSNSISPEVETWKSKISKNFNAELCSKLVASNLLETEHISNTKYRPVLKAFKFTRIQHLWWSPSR